MEPMNVNAGTESLRARCFDLAAAAFSSNVIDLETYESLAGQIASATEGTALQRIAQSLPAPAEAPPTQTQIVDAQASKVRKEGRWLESPHVVLRGNMANMRLDFRAYAMERNLRVHLELDCSMSNIRIIVPGSIDVIERISENKMSTFKNKHGTAGANNAIVVSGNVSMSKVKVTRKRVRL